MTALCSSKTVWFSLHWTVHPTLDKWDTRPIDTPEYSQLIPCLPFFPLTKTFFGKRFKAHWICILLQWSLAVLFEEVYCSKLLTLFMTFLLIYGTSENIALVPYTIPEDIHPSSHPCSSLSTEGIVCNSLHVCFPVPILSHSEATVKHFFLRNILLYVRLALGRKVTCFPTPWTSSDCNKCNFHKHTHPMRTFFPINKRIAFQDRGSQDIISE